MEEKKLLEEGLEEIDHPSTFSEDYKRIKGIKINSFFMVISRIAGELDVSSLSETIKIWVDSFKIKK